TAVTEAVVNAFKAIEINAQQSRFGMIALRFFQSQIQPLKHQHAVDQSSQVIIVRLMTQPFFITAADGDVFFDKNEVSDAGVLVAQWRKTDVFPENLAIAADAAEFTAPFRTIFDARAQNRHNFRVALIKLSEAEIFAYGFCSAIAGDLLEFWIDI